MAKKHPANGPAPPAPTPGKRPSFGGYRIQDKADFAAHADQIKSLARGQDVVEVGQTKADEKRPAAFDRKELEVVRSWVKKRPLEEKSPAAAMIPYPRTWTSKRGRYSKFKLPGAGSYGLVRARPSFV